jgi:hypothetical protein
MLKIKTFCYSIQEKMHNKQYAAALDDVKKILDITDNMGYELSADNEIVAPDGMELLPVKKPRALVPLVELKREKRRRGKTLESGLLRAKNFEFSYEKSIKTGEIIKVLKKKFPGALISVCDEGSTNRKFTVKYNKKKSITCPKQYSVKKVTPIIRTYNDMERSRLKAPDTNLIKACFVSFLNEPNDKDCKMIAEELKLEISAIKIMHHSEYMISATVFYYLKKIGVETNWEKLKLFSLDSKLETYEVGPNTKASAFRCDLLLFFGPKLFIFEYKYRYNRPELQGDAALDCIFERAYPDRVLEVLKTNYKTLMDETTSVVSVGLGFGILNGVVTCDMKFKQSKIARKKIK